MLPRTLPCCVPRPTRATPGPAAALGSPPFSCRWQRSDDAGTTWADLDRQTTRVSGAARHSMALDDGGRHWAVRAGGIGTGRHHSLACDPVGHVWAWATTVQGNWGWARRS